MSPSKSIIRRKPFAPDEKGRFEDIYCDKEGFLFMYSFNLRGKGFYMAIGTHSLLDPNTRQPMVIYDSKAEKQTLASIPIHISSPKNGENVETLIDIELNRTAAILKQRHQKQFNTARQSGKLLSEMTFAEAEHAFLDAGKMAFSSTASMQNRYSSSVHSFAKELSGIKISRIKKNSLLGVVSSMKDGGLRKLQDLKEFVLFIEHKQRISSGLLQVVESAITSIPKGQECRSK